MSWYRCQLVSSFIVYAVGGIGMYRALSRFVCLAYPLILLGMGMSAEIMLKKSKQWSWLVYGLTSLSRIITSNSLVYYMNVDAWNGYLNNVARNATTNFGHEVTDPDKHKIKWTKSGLIALTPARKKAMRQANAAMHSKDLHKFLTLTKKANRRLPAGL